jgi:hypothetical protein
VLGLLAILLAVLAAGVAAASLRLPSLVSTMLAAYLALVVTTAGAALALSPIREVTPGGLAALDGALLAGALAC